MYLSASRSTLEGQHVDFAHPKCAGQLPLQNSDLSFVRKKRCNDSMTLFIRLYSTEGSRERGSASRIPSHVSALCAQPCVHTQITSLCSESSPQIVQTSPSRLAGASALTSPIHPSLDACQPGAARAVSMETSNKSAHTLHSSIHLRGERRPENKPAPEFLSFIYHL